MKSFTPRALFLFCLGLLLGGCASFDAQVEHGRSLAKVQRYFVVSNNNDNHALDQQIAEALKARGYVADTGPLTMMPENTQAVVMFQDHWSWDFGDHLAFLKIAVRDPLSEQSFATVTFNARVPGRENTPEIVSQLVDRLFDNHPSTHQKSDSLDQDPNATPSKKRSR
jgi:hypothetical protein